VPVSKLRLNEWKPNFDDEDFARQGEPDLGSRPPFTLNSAVDQLLKNEFDEYRAKGEPHPLLLEAGIAA